jgi:hypothetical protein
VSEHTTFQSEWIDLSVTLALSALTTVTTLEQQGYALMHIYRPACEIYRVYCR